MTRKHLTEVTTYAKIAAIVVKQERTGYFEHTVFIGRQRHTKLDSAIAHIDRLKTKTPVKLR
jgi:hypothetical protein